MTRHDPLKRLRTVLLFAFSLAVVTSCSDMVGFDPEGDGTGSTSFHAADTGAMDLDGGCSSDCIIPGTGVYFPVSETMESTLGRNTKVVSYSAYNTEDRFVVDVTYEITTGRSNAHATITIGIDGVTQTFEEVEKGATVTYEVDLPPGWEACDEVTYSVRQEGLGRPIEFSGTYALVPVAEPVLWNRLGSIQEVIMSEIGPGGIPRGSFNFEHEVQFGKGFTPNTGRAGSGVDFPTTVADPERGAIEFWAKFYDLPRAYRYGVYGFVNASHWSHNVLSFDWYNGTMQGDTGKLQFVLVFNGQGRVLEYRPFGPELDEPVHLAVVWDRGGIEGSGDYMRIYVDGEIVAANSQDHDWGASNTSGTFRVGAPWDNDFQTDRYTLDNLKVWDFAKTDFSDRFDE